MLSPYRVGIAVRFTEVVLNEQWPFGRPEVTRQRSETG